MRYLAPLLFIGLFALGIHFVNKNTPLMEASNEINDKAVELQEKLDEKLGGQLPEGSIPENIQNDDQSAQLGQSPSNEMINEEAEDIVLTGQDDSEEEAFDQSQPDYDEQELEEYAEKVSDEDFSEFLGAALEEISEDPEMARAIVVEMAKIYKVQPDHQQKIIQFYEDCARSSKIPDEIKNICDRERYNLK